MISGIQVIRISFVIPTLDQSGAERQLTLLATELPKFGVQSSVVALNRGGFYEQRLRDAGVPVTILQKRFRLDPITWIRLRRELKKQQPDIVQSFLFSANSYVRLPGICPPGAKVVVSERCVDSWKSGWQLATDRRLASRMAAMTVNSESVADFYRDTVGIPSDQVHVIPNAVCFDASPADESEVSIRDRFGLSADSRLVAFVGRLAEQKCVHDLVWAFQLLHQAVDNVHLVIAGDGPERERLAELATSFGCRDKIIFTGHWEDSQSLFNQIDAFCLPSSFEGMSNSLMEAMLAKVPVATSDISANRALVDHESTGLIFPQGDGPEMAKALKRLLTDSDLAGRLVASAHQKMVDQYPLHQMVERHLHLYRSLMESKSP